MALYLEGVFPLGTWYHNGSPCPYHPLKITTSVGALVNFFKIRVSGNAQGNFLKNVLVLYVRIFQIM